MFRKKVIGLTMIALMIGCMVVPAGAHETDDVATVSEIMPRGAICDFCGEGEMIRKTDTITNTDNYPCSHYDHGRDIITFVQEVVYWKCNKCKKETNRTVTNQYYVTDCQGYD